MKARDLVAQAIGASKTNALISNGWQPDDRKNMFVEIYLSAVTQAAGITLKLMGSFDGKKFYVVGDQSHATLTSMTCASATDIANATDTFTENSHAKETGTPVIYKAGTAACAGLTTDTVYYIISVTANTFKLAASYEDAINGVAVNITTDGTGNQIFWDARYRLRMVESDATDAAQLPVPPYVAVAVTTGAGDSITVSEVYS